MKKDRELVLLVAALLFASQPGRGKKGIVEDAKLLIEEVNMQTPESEGWQ